MLGFSREVILLVELFGSLATNDYTQYSDADILVVFDRAVDWLEVFPCSDGTVQPVVKSWDALVKLVEEQEPFYLQILRDGLPLFDAGEYWIKLAGYAR